MQQVQMYCGSGTVAHTANQPMTSDALGGLEGEPADAAAYAATSTICVVFDSGRTNNKRQPLLPKKMELLPYCAISDS